MDTVDEGVGKVVQRVLAGDWLIGEAIRPDRFRTEIGLVDPDMKKVRQAAIRMGILEGRTGAGSLVLPRDRWDYRSSELVRGLLAHHYDVTIRRLSEVREAIEPIAASYAAQRSRDDAQKINRLAERIDALGSVSPDEFARNRGAFGEADVQFHTLRVIQGLENNWPDGVSR